MITILVFVLIFFFGLLWSQKVLNNSKSNNRFDDRVSAVDSEFRWDTCEPKYIRPFKGKKNFNPSLGIRNIAKDRNELLLIEKTYLENTKLRCEYMEKFFHKMMFCNESKRSQEALKEFYSTATHFLCKRYPQYFKIDQKKNVVFNLINNDSFPLVGDSCEPSYLLKVLTRNIEEDVLIMLKDDPSNPDEEYMLRASITGSPAGFDPSLNFNKPISFIHNPVPQYHARLETPMHRFFNKLEPKDLWVRTNWSIQTNNVLFKIEDHHARKGDVLEKLSVSDIDFENACFMRCERQILTRLPKSRANIMLVRTYLFPLKSIKAEGLGPELAYAVESLPDDLAFYKRRQVWGDAVCQYLRSN